MEVDTASLHSHETPPKPPDITTNSSFKERLLASENVIQMELGVCSKSKDIATPPTPSPTSPTNSIKAIALSYEETQRLYTPWRFSLIIKLVGKRIAHQYLKSKLEQRTKSPSLIWVPTSTYSNLTMQNI